MALLFRALLLMVLVLAPTSGVRAEGETGKFIEEFAGKAIELASNKQIKASERSQQFAALLERYFDMPAIGQFLLGRYWRTASEQERVEYLKAFSENIVYTYARRFDDYTGQKLVVDGTRQDGAFDIVSSRILDPTNNREYRLEWRVVQSGGAFKVADVVIEGVSMSVTQRQEYASVIQNNGGKVQALIDALNKQMAGLKADD